MDDRDHIATALGLAEGSAGGCSSVTWSPEPAGLCPCSRGLAGAGCGLWHRCLPWPPGKRLLWSPRTHPAASEASPRASRWRQLWECVVWAGVPTQTAAQLTTALPPPRLSTDPPTKPEQSCPSGFGRRVGGPERPLDSHTWACFSLWVPTHKSHSASLFTRSGGPRGVVAGPPAGPSGSCSPPTSSCFCF